jgi:ATP-dependent DNA helicase RecG
VGSIQVDAALEQAPELRAPSLLGIAEDQWFDRKSIRVKANTLAQHLVAFANAEGGTLVVGLSGGRFEGIDAHQDRVNALMQAGIDFTDPPVRTVCEQVPCVVEGRSDHILVIRLDPAERLHRTTSGDCYLRIGDESRMLNFLQQRELLFDKGQSQYDGEPAPGAAVEDLDAGLVSNFAATIGHPVEDRVLNARSLVTRQGALTNAAYLLFARRPQDLFPQAYVRVIRYLERERGTGSRMNVAEGQDFRLEGPIPVLLEQPQLLIEKFMPHRRALGPDGRFVSTAIVPRDAWLEGMVNAVIHRSYSLAGDHIRIEIYPDRIEIESPGRLPGLVDVSSPMKIARFARNPRIARVCADLRITQELGEGIKRIFEEMRLAGLEDPLYRQTSGSARLVLTARLDPAVAAALPNGSADVLRLLQFTDHQLGTGDVAEALRISRPTAVKRLGALRDAGLVDWHGKAPNDPRAYWTATSP